MWYDLASITFYGNAPSTGSGWKTGCGSNMTVSCYQGATGFTAPSWNGVIVHVMTSPNAPRNLTAVLGDCSVSLSWNAPSGCIGVSNVGYCVYHNGTYVSRVVGNTVKIGNLTNGLSFNFTVVFPTTKGNLQNSTSIQVKLPTIGVAVDGTVCDIAGNAIVNATVTLSNYTAFKTTQDGFYVFTGVKAGNYSLSIAKEGYSTITRNVTATSGHNSNLNSTILQANDTSNGGSGDGDMTLIIVFAVVAVAGAVAVYFLFFRK